MTSSTTTKSDTGAPHLDAGLRRAHEESRRSRRLGRVAVAAMVLVVGGAWWRCAGPAAPAAHRETPVEIRSTGPAFASLHDLVDASPLVVIGRAVASDAGRVFSADDGEGGAAAAVQSEVVVLEVGAVLAGADPGPTIAVEEEARVVDGPAIVVDGLRPTAVGDEGIFFLQPVDDGSAPYFVTVATSGRFIRASLTSGDDALLGADTALARMLVHMGGRALTDAVIARAASTGRGPNTGQQAR